MKIVDMFEQIRHNFGNRIALLTPLKITNYVEETQDAMMGVGVEVNYILSLKVRTIIRDTSTRNGNEFQHARDEAVKYMKRELYGEIADRLVEISYRDYETNQTADREVRDLINQLITELRE